jgi:hypothetical protein
VAEEEKINRRETVRKIVMKAERQNNRTEIVRKS